MLSRGSQSIVHAAFSLAVEFLHKHATALHLVLALLEDTDVRFVLSSCFTKVYNLKSDLNCMLSEDSSMERFPVSTVTKTDGPLEVKPSPDFCDIVHTSVVSAHSDGMCEVTPARLLSTILCNESSDAYKFFSEHGINFDDVVSAISAFEEQQRYKALKIPYSGFDMGQKDKKAEQGKKFGSFQILSSNAEDPLGSYCINLNEQVRRGKIDAVVGREHLIDRSVKILCRRKKNNLVYVGEPGVGKSAVVDGLAVKVARNEIPELYGSEIYALDMASLVAGTRYRGDFEERIKSLIATITSRKNIILFIDEVHLIVGAGSTTGGSLDAGNLLKPVLSRGMFRCIGATTCKEYSLSFEKDPALARRFQRVDVDESSVEETVQVLSGIRHYYEAFHKVVYTKASLKLIAEIADKYITGQMMPDKAVGLMDDAGVIVRFSKNSNNIVRCEDVRQAASSVIGKNVSGDVGLTFNTVMEISNELQKNIFGQEEAVSTLIDALKISAMGLRKHDRPLLSTLLVGPTGVGKTSIVNHLANLMKVKLIRFDMSEYSEPHSVSKIIGSPPGYVGYDSGGLLTAEVFRSPHSVVLLDEMEKAHRDVYNLFLQVMDYGWMSDTFGRKVDFRNTIIVMTSNVGMAESISSGYGFEGKSGNISMFNIQKAVEKTFSPEFRGRLDAVVFFNPLNEDIVKKVIQKFVSEFAARLAKQGITFIVLESATDYISKFVCKKSSGVRSIESFFRNEISSKVADLFMLDGHKSKVTIEVGYNDGPELEYKLLT